MSLAEQTLSAIRRSNQTYYEQIAERETLGCGIAFLCPQFPGLYDGNHLREAIIPSRQSLSQAFEEVEALYASRDLRCYRWVPAADQPIEPFESLLTPRGFRASESLGMILTRETSIPVRSDVRILPARAMRKALRELRKTDDRYDEATREMLADAENERQDDPHYDGFIATIKGEPAARGALFQVGEIGRLKNIFVSKQFRRQGVGLTLMAHLLAMSRRLAMRYTVVEVAPDNEPAVALYRRCGFDPGGSYVEFIAPI